MKKLALILLLSAAMAPATMAQVIGGQLVGSLNTAVTAEIDATLDVIAPITITNVVPIDFGTMISESGNTYNLDPNGGAPGAGQLGSFTINAAGGSSVEVNGGIIDPFGASITWTPQLSVATGTSIPVGGVDPFTQQALTINIGGQIDFTAAPTAGAKTATYEVSVDYTSI